VHEERDERVIGAVATRALSRFLRSVPLLQLFLSLSFSLPLILSLFFFFLSPSLFRARAREKTASSRGDGRARSPCRIVDDGRSGRVCRTRHTHTRRLACHACREDQRKGERSSVAPRRARATVQIRLSGPLAQAEAGHRASGAWRTPVEACARTAAGE